MNRILRTLRTAALAATALASVGTAAVAALPPDFLDRLSQVESGGDHTAQNQYGYTGLFQHGGMALEDAGIVQCSKGAGRCGNNWSSYTWTDYAQQNGINSVDDYRNNAAFQQAAQERLVARQEQYYSAYGMDRYVGQTINGRTLTREDIMAGMHLVGPGGMNQFLQSGGAYNPVDGNGVSVTEYMARVNGGTPGTPGGAGGSGTGSEYAGGVSGPGCDPVIEQALLDYSQLGIEQEVTRAAASLRAPVTMREFSCLDDLLGMSAGVRFEVPTGEDIMDMIRRQVCSIARSKWNEATSPLTGAINGAPSMQLPGLSGFPGFGGTGVDIWAGRNYQSDRPGLIIDGPSGVWQPIAPSSSASSSGGFWNGVQNLFN